MTISEKIVSCFQSKQEQSFTSIEVVDMVLTRFPDTNRGSIMPADYCYNKTNKGNNFEFPFPLFEYENGIYKYLGPDFPYTGKAYWKGILIGEWIEGSYKLLHNSSDLDSFKKLD